MLQIFKYFIGVIAVLILVYVLIVILRTVLVTGFSTGAAVVTNSAVQNTVASSTLGAARAVSTFSLTSWLQNFRPFQYAPVQVMPSETTGNSNFYGNSSGFWSDPAMQTQLYWQNLNSAPNNHPTDYVPLTNNGSRWFGNLNSNNQENVIPDKTDSFLSVNLQNNAFVESGDTLSGHAHVTMFTDNTFPIYIFDESGEVISSTKAFMNGNVNKSGFVPFRAVLNFNPGNARSGYIMFKNANSQAVGYRVLKSINVNFIGNPSMKLLFPSKANTNTQASQCVIGGCSMQICGSQEEIRNLVTTCEYNPADACFRAAICEFDRSQNRCAWRVDNQLAMCLQNAR